MVYWEKQLVQVLTIEICPSLPQITFVPIFLNCGLSWHPMSNHESHKTLLFLSATPRLCVKPS